MNKGLSDTHPETEKRMIELIRSLSPSQRFSKALYLTSVTLSLSKRAIARANPEKNAQELDILFVEYHYGKKLAEKVKKYLNERNSTQ